jgi:hypothetical protein
MKIALQYCNPSLRCLLVLLALTVLPNLAMGSTQTPSLIINPQLSVTSISRNKARSIFSMRLREWPDGTPIVVYVLPDQAQQHRDFVQKRLSMFPHQLRRHWDRYVYTGIGQAPIEVANSTEMIERVNNTAGAIGYAEEESTDAKIRIIPLD